MPAIPDLLERIRRRPPLYLGECSLSALYHTIIGYQLALGMHAIKDDASLRLPNDFDDWVAYRLRYKESTSGWKRMILEATGDEATALSRFFDLLDEYATRKSRVVARLVKFQPTYSEEFARCINGLDIPIKLKTVSPGDRVEGFPTRIALVVYSDDPGFFAVTDESDVSLPWPGFFPSLDWFETATKVHRSQLEVIDPETFKLWIENAEE